MVSPVWTPGHVSEIEIDEEVAKDGGSQASRIEASDTQAVQRNIPPQRPEKNMRSHQKFARENPHASDEQDRQVAYGTSGGKKDKTRIIGDGPHESVSKEYPA